MTTEDIILRAIGGAIGGAIAFGIFGFIVALVIKAFRRHRPIPKWPIIVLAMLGALLSVALRILQAQISN